MKIEFDAGGNKLASRHQVLRSLVNAEAWDELVRAAGEVPAGMRVIASKLVSRKLFLLISNKSYCVI